MNLAQINNQINLQTSNSNYLVQKSGDTNHKTDDVYNKNKTFEISLNNAHTNSNFYSKISNIALEISKVQTVKQNITTQMNILNDMKTTYKSYQDGSIDVKSARVSMANLVDNYNNGIDNIAEKLRKLEDLKGKSPTYFDGIAGAIPPKSQGAFSAEAQYKTEQLQEIFEKVNNLNKTYKQDIFNTMQQEKAKTTFKNIRLFLSRTI